MLDRDWYDLEHQDSGGQVKLLSRSLSGVISRETPTLIRGEELTVKVDESKFGKQKYSKRRLVDGQWVIGRICRETKDIFLTICPNNKSDAPTLLDIIERHVHKKSPWWRTAGVRTTNWTQTAGGIWQSTKNITLLVCIPYGLWTATVDLLLTEATATTTTQRRSTWRLYASLHYSNCWHH